MPKPTELISWATNAAYTVDADPWAGDPNKLDPGAARRVEGAEPDTFPAEWFNYHLNAVGKHIEYIHDVLEGADTVDGATWEQVFAPVIMSYDSGEFVHAGQSSLTVTGTRGWAGMDLSRFIPGEATITQIEVLVFKVNADAVGNRFEVTLDAETPDWVTPGASSTVNVFTQESDGNTGYEVIDSGVLSHAMDSNDIHLLRVRAPVVPSPGAAIVAVRITFDDPGPINR